MTDNEAMQSKGESQIEPEASGPGWPGETEAEELAPAEAIVPEEDDEDSELDCSHGLSEWELEGYLWLYRERTLSLLRRYLRYSVEVGRLPSLLGRELFRAKITQYRVTTFEDAVIFVHDVEQALEQLDEWDRDLIATMVMQDFTQHEAAQQIGCWRRTVGRRLRETLDRLSKIFLLGGILTPLPGMGLMMRNSCQEAKMSEIPISDCS